MDPRTAPAKKRVGRAERVEATTFLYAIIDAAAWLREAKAFDGAQALPLDARSDLLRALEARRMPPIDWLFTLLNGLAPARMKSCEHVLRVLAARLARYEKEMRAAARARGRVPGA